MHISLPTLFLGQGDELRGADPAQLGRMPTDKHFVAHDPPLGVDAGLGDEAEVIALAGATQQADHGQALQAMLVEARFVGFNARPAQTLGVAQGRSGIEDQGLGLLAVFGVDRETRARGQRERCSGDRQGFGQGSQQCPSGGEPVLGIVARRANREQLVAAPAGQQPALRHGGEGAFGAAGEHAIGFARPEPVVDDLELVEVQPESRHGTVAGLRDPRDQRLHRGGPVDQAGEGVDP